jgi:hypothetical protein
MGRTVQAEYLAGENILKLTQPLEGVKDHANVVLEIRELPSEGSQPWLRLAGSLGEEEGRVVARAVREAFGRDEIEV